MRKLALGLVLAAAATTTHAQVQQNDFVFGYSRSSAAETLELYHTAGNPDAYFSQGNPWATGPTTFIQSVEFDNLGGIQHNAQGNMIGGNFGTTAGGGSISTLATDGSANGTLIAAFNGSGGYTRTRLGSPAISPLNQKIAVAGYDSGELHIVDYIAGNGNGLTGSTSNPRQTNTGGTIAVANDTQGSAWLNERTALVFNGNGQLTAVDSSDMSSTIVADVPATGEGQAFSVTDVDFQPAISPYVYAMNGVFDNNASVTTNTLYVFDPRDGFSLVGQFDFSAVDPNDPVGGFVMQTTREIGFDSNGNLFVSQFVRSGFIGFPIGVDYIEGAADPSNIQDNVVVNTGFTPLYSANFNGLDVANSTEIVPGDANGDGMVTGADYTIWADNFDFGTGGPTEGLATIQMGDFNLDGAVTGADYTIWADNFGAAPAPTAVPEPTTLTLAALGLLGGLFVARRRG